MPGLLVVSHGKLAGELVDAVRRIVADVDALEAVSIGWDVDMEEAGRRIQEAIARVDREGGVLVLTDMFGGTPSNLALSLLEPGRIEVVTGVNLPMLIKCVNLREQGELSEVARRVAEQGRQAIQVASELLGKPQRAEDTP
ncbi:MAG TPA: PTS sugar transporter subunit IIA [Candidatus Polarisedimenticolaceae bacterium]|nr:PTS sugar transporter subunit IIA [Candidatus Polarisedimenticolaceae bacterium]